MQYNAWAGWEVRWRATRDGPVASRRQVPRNLCALGTSSVAMVGSELVGSSSHRTAGPVRSPLSASMQPTSASRVARTCTLLPIGRRCRHVRTWLAPGRCRGRRVLCSERAMGIGTGAPNAGGTPWQAQSSPAPAAAAPDQKLPHQTGPGGASGGKGKRESRSPWVARPR